MKGPTGAPGAAAPKNEPPFLPTYPDANRRSHKNTRRWCRGKPGVAHVFNRIRWIDRPNTPHYTIPIKQAGHWDDFLIDLCQSCGKQVWVSR